MTKRILLVALLVALTASPAFAAQKKPMVMGTNGQPQNLQSGDTIVVNASATGAASINVPQGTAPTSPTNGDLWATSSGVYVRIAGGTGSVADFNLPNFAATSNYVGTSADSYMVQVDGTTGAPSSTSGAVAAFEKVSSASAFNAVAGLAFKNATATGSRATAVYGESVDPVGGSGSFVEGGRFQGTLTGGASGTAYGTICAAGTAASGPTTPGYLIGCEGEVDNQIGPDAPIYSSFSGSNFKASFVATNGVGTGTRYKVDAAFVVNPNSLNTFRTGLYISPKVDDVGVAVASGTSLTSGIDMHLATITYAGLYLPNNVPIRAANAAGSAGLNILSVNGSNNLTIGADITGQAVISPQTYFANGWTTPSNVTILDTSGGLKTAAMVAGGTVPTDNTGTCTNFNAVTGGNAAGAFSASNTCAAGGTIILHFSYTAPHGWVCELNDNTTANVGLRQTAYTTTGCTITTATTTIATSDVMTFRAEAF